MKSSIPKPETPARARATRPRPAAMRHRRAWAAAMAAGLLLAAAPAARAAGGASWLVDGRDFAARVADTTVPFIENRGQLDPAVALYARTFAGTVFVTHAGEIVYALPRRAAAAETGPFGRGAFDLSADPTPPHRLAPGADAGWVLALRETLVGASPGPIRGLRPSDTVVNVFKGNDPARWQSGLRVFEAVDLGEVWPGVGLELVARGNNVEKRFTVAPGASPDVIRIRVEGGAPRLRRERNGQLTVPSELGPVAFTRPVAFQQTDGRPVAVAYASRGDVYGFRVGPYDRVQPLVIDPLLASTLIGGESSDSAKRVVVDGEGSIHLVGSTSSVDFPTTPGAFQSGCVSPDNCGGGFITKFSPDLRRLRASTFLRGEIGELIEGLALDSAGQPVVAGWTTSDYFPTTVLPCPVHESYRWHGFVARLSADLSQLLASTCIATEDNQVRFLDVAVAADGTVYAAGGNGQGEFPVTPEAFDTTQNGSSDVVVARFSADLTRILAATYVGTPGRDDLRHMVLDQDGNVVLAGEYFCQPLFLTDAAGNDIPEQREGACCIGKLDANLTTALGGRDLGLGEIRGMTLDPDGSIWLAGQTWSWPVTRGAFQPKCHAWYCGFATRLAPDVQTILASTYIGGQTATYWGDAWQAVSDGTGGAFVVGSTEERDFPTTPGAWSNTPARYTSGFVARLDPDLTGLVASTFLGGGLSEAARDAALGPDGSVVVMGGTASPDYPTTPGAFDRVVPPQGSRIFVSVFTPDLLADPQPCVHGGDLDFDGETLIDDVQAAFYAVLGLYSPLPWEYCQADCNGDDRLTAGDAQAAFAKFLGLGACADDPAP